MAVVSPAVREIRSATPTLIGPRMLLRPSLVVVWLIAPVGVLFAEPDPIAENILLYQRESGPRIRSTLAYIYTMATLLILVALAAVGRFTLADVQAGLLLVPGFIFGFICSRPLALRFDHGATRYIVLGVSAAAAVLLIVTSLGS